MMMALLLRMFLGISMSLWGINMSDTSINNSGNIARTCAYNINGVCILSDCKCQAMSDGKLVCSSYKEKSK